MTNKYQSFELKADQMDESLNKRVKILILQQNSSEGKFIVYLDEELNTQWRVDPPQTIDEFGQILNRVSILELKSDFLKPGFLFDLFKGSSFSNLFIDKSLIRIRSMLGEAIARGLDEKNYNLSDEILRSAEDAIKSKNVEYSHKWYFGRASKFMYISMAIEFLVYFDREILSTILGKEFVNIFFYALFGSVGAYLFMAKRENKTTLDATSGALIHRMEATYRVIAGIVSAALACLLIKSGLIFPTINQLSQPYVLIVISVLAGYSERVIPSMVRNFEGQTQILSSQSSKKLDDQNTPPTHLDESIKQTKPIQDGVSEA